MLTWYRRQWHMGLGMVMAGAALCGGWLLGVAAGEPPVTVAQTRTLHETAVQTVRRTITVRVDGHVVSHHDHVLVVYVPRVVFRTSSRPTRTVVVPAHVVRVRQTRPTPSSPPVAAIVGVGPAPVTVTVPVTVSVPYIVPGPVTTTTETITEPGTTTTVTVTLGPSP